MATIPPELNAAIGEMPDASTIESKVVCIAMSPDGMFSVYMKDDGLASEVAEMPEAEQDADAVPAAKQASNLDEAFEMARMMLEGDELSPEDQMMAGYNKGGSFMAKKPSPAQVFGG